MTGSIPSSFHQFFWDTDPKTIDLKKHQNYIIARLLDKGNWQAVKWIKSKYSNKNIKQVILQNKGLMPPTVYFWANYLNFSPQQAACLQTPYRQQRKKHWNN